MHELELLLSQRLMLADPEATPENVAVLPLVVTDMALGLELLETIRVPSRLFAVRIADWPTASVRFETLSSLNENSEPVVVFASTVTDTVPHMLVALPSHTLMLV